MSTVTICKPPQFLIRRIAHCPTCKTRRRFVGVEALWYGTTWTCCRCGESWCDGERMLRPAVRGWRTEAAKKARAKWDQAGPYDKAAHSVWLRAQLDCA